MCQTLQNQQLVPAGQTDRQSQASASGRLGTLPSRLLRREAIGGGEYAAALLAPNAARELGVGVTVEGSRGTVASRDRGSGTQMS